MSRRAGRLAAGLGALVALLFAGRWGATVLADRWWARELSPAAAAFLTDWHILRLTLDLAGVVLAAAWFIGHLLLVYRAIGSVQVRRNVANLEFREALTPGALLAVVVGTGALIGLLVGTGVSGSWESVALGWHGVRYGVADPLLQLDAGTYVAQLPLWRAAHGLALLLVLLALGLVFALYLVVGAVRWIDGRPAINGHARSHLGWLLAGLALSLLWGYLLEPYELIAGLAGPVEDSAWRATSLVAPILAGVALATAGLTAAWALRPRHALAAAGWIVLSSASLVGHWMVPPAMAGEGRPAVEPRVSERLERLAYRLESLDETGNRGGRDPGPPKVPSLWNAPTITQLLAADSVRVLAVDPAVITHLGRRRPAWLAARVLPGGRLGLAAIADDRTSPAGEPLFYQTGDSAAHPVPAPLVELTDAAFRPEAPDYRVNGPDGPGVPADGLFRRLTLAWALQAGGLLGQQASGARVDWALAPEERLARLTPFAEWGAAVPRVIDGELVWLADGYLAPGTFPLSRRVEWRGRSIGSLEAGFLGTVEAATGVTRIFLRPGAGALAEAWADVSRGVVEPPSAVPEPLLRAAPYPTELFRVQARQVEQGPWKPGALWGRPPTDPSEPARENIGWSADSAGPLLLASYERASERRTTAVLVGRREEGQDVLALVRLDSAVALPSRSALESRWSRFASYDALSDSIREDGGTLEKGPIRLELEPGGAVAYQAFFARRGAEKPRLAWVSVAAGAERLGAGRTLPEAWSNLLGTSVPSMPGSAQATRLDEARRWLDRADSALRVADWTAFGRAWQGLRRALGITRDTTLP
jgi:hypothetical protein